MKKYEKPTMEVIDITTDIITASCPLFTPCDTEGTHICGFGVRP